jgi:ribosome-binding factor A
MIRREMGELLRTEVRDGRVAQGMVCITTVVVAGDLQHCKVSVSIYGSETEQAEAMAGLRSAAPYLRGELSRRLNMRRTPELVFHHDKGLAAGVEVLGLLNRLAQERSKAETKAEIEALEGEEKE